MIRFKNQATGVVVRVDDATAARLGKEWEQVGGSRAVPAPVKTTEVDPKVSAKESAPSADSGADVSAVKRPNKNANRGDWADYVESIGLEHNDLTRAQLIELVETKEAGDESSN